MATRRNDNDLESNCFAWLAAWRSALPNTIAGAQELYQKLLPRTMYHQRRTALIMQNVWHIPRTTSHMLSSCSALAPTKYLARHNSVLKNLFFELLRKLGLIDTTPFVFSLSEPTETSALKLIGMCHSLCWEHSSQSKENLDARIINLHEEDKTIALLEMSCPWIENREAKESEKTRKYAPLCFELKMAVSRLWREPTNRNKDNCSTLKVLPKTRPKARGHPTTVFCKISVRRSKYCLEFSILEDG